MPALLAGLADMAAIAIHNARLLERERQVAVLEERDNLAREMHDTLAQVLTKEPDLEEAPPRVRKLLPITRRVQSTKRGPRRGRRSAKTVCHSRFRILSRTAISGMAVYSRKSFGSVYMNYRIANGLERL